MSNSYNIFEHKYFDIENISDLEHHRQELVYSIASVEAQIEKAKICFEFDVPDEDGNPPRLEGRWLMQQIRALTMARMYYDHVTWKLRECERRECAMKP